MEGIILGTGYSSEQGGPGIARLARDGTGHQKGILPCLDITLISAITERRMVLGEHTVGLYLEWGGARDRFFQRVFEDFRRFFRRPFEGSFEG